MNFEISSNAGNHDSNINFFCLCTLQVREDASIGEPVGSVSGAGTAGRVAFTLNSLTPLTQFAAFDVDRGSGQLVVAHSLDRENVSEYHLDIRALDTTSIGNPQSIAVSVKIIIEDANDNPPSWPQDPITIRVSEGSIIGSTIYNLTASDRDSGLNGDLTYDLVSEFPTSGNFAVDSLTGALTLAGSLDREERSDYTLIIRASDCAPIADRLAATVTARIVVLDQNDNDPVFVAPESTTLPASADLKSGMQKTCSLPTNEFLIASAFVRIMYYTDIHKQKFYTIAMSVVHGATKI